MTPIWGAKPFSGPVAAHSAAPELLRGLTSAVLLDGSARVADLSGNPVTATGAVSRRIGRSGPEAAFAGTTGNMYTHARVEPVPAHLTLLARVRLDANPTFQTIAALRDGNSVAWQLRVGNGSGDGRLVLTWAKAGSFSSFDNFNLPSMPLGEDVTVGVRANLGDLSTYDLLIDGKVYSVPLKSGPNTSDSTAVPVTIGDRYSMGMPWQGRISAVYRWARPLSAAEIQQVTSDPFAPFRPRRTLVAVAAGGSGGTPLALSGLSEGSGVTSASPTLAAILSGSSPGTSTSLAASLAALLSLSGTSTGAGADTILSGAIPHALSGTSAGSGDTSLVGLLLATRMHAASSGIGADTVSAVIQPLALSSASNGHSGDLVRLISGLPVGANEEFLGLLLWSLWLKYLEEWYRTT